MTSNLRDVAESRFAALTRREKDAMTQVEADHLAITEKTARLRAQRLAREAETTANHTEKFKRHRAAKLSS